TPPCQYEKHPTASVCTHPEYREQGIGSMLVRKATEWIMQDGRFDIGLFTCSHRNTPFYEHIGWLQKGIYLPFWK
ncbi:GNAT family N-acetyltransferase, partial [Akkermansia sp.]|uniref:GNAT family N-acetyltransferase n=1 Tax=Akkermansia sp. TaxID=1872421 RepID=UPI003AB6900C